jgi:parvulin-like peptidyl-prolyl isomerase
LLRVIGRLASILVLLGVLAPGCADQAHLPPVDPLAGAESRGVGDANPEGEPSSDPSQDRSEAAPLHERLRSSDDPALVLDGRPIPMRVLSAQMHEIAGAEVLADVILTAKLERELDRRGLTISEQDIEDERARLISAIEDETGADPDSAARMLDDLREQRGLGPVRFPALLKRNAMLRQLARTRLAQEGEAITEEDIQRRYDILHGRRFAARVITLSTEREAANVRAQLGDAPTVDTFSAMAVRVSTDASGARGGSLEPISPRDPAYEAVVRKTLDGLEPGKASHVVALESGFAIFLLEEVLPPSETPLAEVSEKLRADLTSRQERVFMDRFAKELLSEASVTIFDRSLEWSWRTR